MRLQLRGKLHSIRHVIYFHHGNTAACQQRVTPISNSYFQSKANVVLPQKSAFMTEHSQISPYNFHISDVGHLTGVPTAAQAAQPITTFWDTIELAVLDVDKDRLGIAIGNIPW